MVSILSLTKDQRLALRRVWVRWSPSVPYKKFLATVSPTFGCDNAVAVPAGRMWLLVETDGHTHS